MKKFMLWIMVAVCVMVSVEPVFAVYTIERLTKIKNRKEAKIYEEKMWKFEEKMSSIAEDVGKLANKIAEYNKPIFEAKLTKKERRIENEMHGSGTSPIVWNKVCAKNKTVMLGLSRQDKKFWAFYFKTADPALIFSGGIRVGADIKTLERFFGDSITNIGYVNGNVITLRGPANQGTDVPNPTVTIKCIGGKVAEIFFDASAGGGFKGMGCISLKALDFANKQAKQMGLSSLK